MDFKNRQHLLIFGAVLCLAVLLGDSFVFTPLVRVWKRHGAAIVQLKQDLDRGRNLLDRRAALEKRWSDIRARSLSTRKSEAENRLLKTVDQWGRENRLAMTALKPRWIDDPKGETRLELVANAQGTMEAVARFLFALETAPMTLKVEDIEVTSKDQTGEALSVRLRLTGLLLAEASAAPAEAAAENPGKGRGEDEKTTTSSRS